MAPSATEPEKSVASETAVPQVGMECELKNLYQKEDERGRTSWSDKLPDNLEEAAENEMTARYAILVCNLFKYFLSPILNSSRLLEEHFPILCFVDSHTYVTITQQHEP